MIHHHIIKDDGDWTIHYRLLCLKKKILDKYIIYFLNVLFSLITHF